MNSITQGNEYTVRWAAPEILEGVDAITLEADVFAFGMVMIEVCPHASNYLVSSGWMVHLTSKSCLRFLRESIHSVDSQPWLLL